LPKVDRVPHVHAYFASPFLVLVLGLVHDVPDVCQPSSASIHLAYSSLAEWLPSRVDLGLEATFRQHRNLEVEDYAMLYSS
jgi:hypothetical protein